MKAILSNRIYMEVTPDYEQYLRDHLTYEIENYSNPAQPIIIRNYSVIRRGLITLPIGRIDLIPSDYEIKDKRVQILAQFPEFKGVLRPSQAEIHDEVVDNCIINAKVSWGKTFTGAAIAGKLGLKTLVIVHTLPLMNQWAKEMRKVYGFEPGLIGNGHDRIDAPITIGNVRSLYTRMDKLNKAFGTIILDEMHHVSSPTFSKVVDASYARYKIGLSGTIQRKDGKHIVFRDYFGSKVFKPAAENRVEPVVHIWKSGLHFPDGTDGWANRVTRLTQMGQYRDLCCALLAHYREQGHQVLLVSDRTEFLRHVSGQCGSSLIIGDTVDRDGELEKIEQSRSLCGTQSIVSEGFSHDPLSCLILGTPVNNDPLLEQLAGRIQRIAPGKPRPVLVDIALGGYTAERQLMNRIGFYMKQGWEIKHLS
jgi:superfamily II DNA or RNA helicase